MKNRVKFSAEFESSLDALGLGPKEAECIASAICIHAEAGISGPPSNVIVQGFHQIDGGTSSELIFRYALWRDNCAQPQWIVHKVLRNDRSLEPRVAGLVQSASLTRPSLGIRVTPILLVHTIGEFSSILMEYVPDFTKQTMRTWKRDYAGVARMVGRFSGRLSLVDGPLPRLRDLKPMSSGHYKDYSVLSDIEYFLDGAKPSESGLSVSCREIIAAVHELHAYAESNVRQLLSHNDLTPNNANYHREPSKGNGQLTILDWGEATENFLGSDLRPLMKVAINKPSRLPLILRAYLEGLEDAGYMAQRSEVEIGAMTNWMRYQMLSSFNRPSPENFQAVRLVAGLVYRCAKRYEVI